jgi:hypothetical protein
VIHREEGREEIEEGKQMNQPNREYFLKYDEPLEYITSIAVGFPVEVYWGDGAALQIGSNPDYYQIMPHTQVEEGRQDVSYFWGWHLAHNRQWFETPVEAAAAFVKAWESRPKKGSAK